MLKNKKAIYILIPLNIFIWGYFIYKFCSLYGGPEEEINVTAKMSEGKSSERKNYVLHLNYKDPFLEGSSTPVSKARIQQQDFSGKKEKVIVVKTPTVQVKTIPSIQYVGLVRNSVSGSSTALIFLNGQSKIVRANEVIEGMVFKSFNKDSLVAKWGREQIVVRR